MRRLSTYVDEGRNLLQDGKRDFYTLVVSTSGVFEGGLETCLDLLLFFSLALSEIYCYFNNSVA
jgi:hypothetical protein